MRHRHPDHVRPSLLAQRAAQMRYQLNPAEAALWAELNAGKLGVVFRRQVVVLGRYIADFLAPSLKLIVEVDGSHHARRVSADVRRDEALRRAGYRVLRLEAQAVLRAPREAALAVRRALGHG
jgi:very-short-patch-repair endonuclease